MFLQSPLLSEYNKVRDGLQTYCLITSLSNEGGIASCFHLKGECMNYREQQEEREEKFLAPWAAHAASSKGRACYEHPDIVRTCFQRDRDRIIHSRAFRRLKHKTQVFINPEQDHTRTRLTHTLEVAQIARTVSRALRLNEDLTEAIALAHDLGHTPFGHAGEQALDAALKSVLPNQNFRHYEQSLRVVEVLEKHGVGPGLNLTWETRDGIMHHSKGIMDMDDPDAVVSETCEGQVVRIADRVAYLNHDIDDAIRAGILKEEDIPSIFRKTFGATSSQRISSMVMNILQHSEGKRVVSMSADYSKLTDELKDFMFERVYWNPEVSGEENRKARNIVTALFHAYIQNPEKFEPDAANENWDIEERARRACDFVAGMTDRYAVAFYNNLFQSDSA